MTLYNIFENSLLSVLTIGGALFFVGYLLHDDKKPYHQQGSIFNLVAIAFEICLVLCVVSAVGMIWTRNL